MVRLYGDADDAREEAGGVVGAMLYKNAKSSRRKGKGALQRVPR